MQLLLRPASKGSRLLIASAVSEEDRPKSAADVRASLSFVALPVWVVEASNSMVL